MNATGTPRPRGRPRKDGTITPDPNARPSVANSSTDSGTSAQNGAPAAGTDSPSTPQEETPSEHLGPPSVEARVNQDGTPRKKRGPNRAKEPAPAMDPAKASRTGKAAAFIYCQPFELISLLLDCPEMNVMKSAEKRREAEEVFTDLAMDKGDFLGEYGPYVRVAGMVVSNVVAAGVAYKVSNMTPEKRLVKKQQEGNGAVTETVDNPVEPWKKGDLEPDGPKAEDASPLAGN
jgi:hypothetical protein